MATQGIISGSPLDKISNLPDHVIIHILKWLPIRDVAKTSILSKDWRYKWLNVPDLVFNSYFKDSLDKELNPFNVIEHVLRRHGGPITKFTFWDPEIDYQPPIELWFFFLSRHPIQNLTIRLASSSGDYSIPHIFFSFDKLRDLYISHLEITTPPEFKGFHRLVKLYLANVLMQSAELKRFISKCSMLEWLCLSSDDSETYLDWDIDIVAPRLKSFRFIGPFRSFTLKRSNVEVIEFCNPDNTEVYEYVMLENFKPVNNLIKVFRQLPRIRRLVSNNSFLQYLSIGGVPPQLPRSLYNLRFLQLTYIECRDMLVLKCALCLIRSSPNLQSLELSFESAKSVLDKLPATQHLIAQQKSKIPMSCLKMVKIRNFTKSKPHMEFVKLLLLSETVLSRLEIYASVEYPDQVLEMLTSYLRPSSAAEIILE